ncbi:peptidase m20 [Grosmannia clavigera kw1407]|uniref:Peptidase m20 n=2 Tax=Ophiostomataceae TaxID=5152 RepID=F0X8R8_GROCL|nr:peptidase m20 [Grosmannia clavigera kw1407]EFX05757.1 peptidase m20 [Grosmannia clavigera kw1407]
MLNSKKRQDSNAIITVHQFSIAMATTETLLESDGFVLVSHADAVELGSREAREAREVSGRSASPPRYLAAISACVDQASASLWPLNRHIHDHPELAFHEFEAHRRLTAFYEGRAIGSGNHSARWTVTREAYGMRTAWVAVYDSGRAGPVVSFNVEMDALPGVGHACGHNLIATASVAGSLATAEVMWQHRLGGKIVVFGTPAEEDGGGKVCLLEAGAYREHGADVSLITHPSTTTPSAMMRTTAITNFMASYEGRAAHAAASPWQGVNALDALVQAYTGLSMLRQQTAPGDIIQGRITDGGAATNIIHEHAAGEFAVRAPSKRRLAELRQKVDGCFRAGAEATGARLTLDERGGYADHIPNRLLACAYSRYWNELVRQDPAVPDDEHIPDNLDVDDARGRTLASTDQGDVSYAMPSLSAGFRIPSIPIDGSSRPGGGPHTVDFERAAGTRIAFEHALRAGKGLAGTALDVLTVDGLLDQVKRAWKEDMEDAMVC